MGWVNKSIHNEMMKTLGIGIRIHKIFSRGVKDKSEFLQWASQRFPNDKRNVLLPCHGAVYDAPDLSERVTELINSNFS